ncbi:C40 family peptidase [candidate division KSB1 bacterium]|nr:C40 family peptidase [candidate division KSB1 bacterium]
MKKYLISILLLFLGCAYPPVYRENPQFQRKENPRQVSETEKSENIFKSDLVDNFKEQIRKFYGTPYVWGGASQAGTDCSGLIVALYQNAADITLPHSAQQLYHRGKKIHPDQLSFGDLVFFDTFGNRKITHVGFYVSNGFFLHASSSNGVKLSKLSDPPFKDQFVGARRIL